MTVLAFQQSIRHKYRFERYWSWGISIIAVLIGLWLAFYYSVGPFSNMANNRFGQLMAFALITIGVIGMLVLRTKYNASIICNKESKETNLQKIQSVSVILGKSGVTGKQAYVTLIYQPSWWRPKYIVYLLAENNVLAVNVQSGPGSKGGFIDFGASKRLERKIVSMLYGSL